MSNKTSGFKRAIGIVLGVITMLVLIALFVVLVMAPIPNIWVDKVAASDNAIDQTVSPTQSETYCPAPIGLADTGTYGDSAAMRRSAPSTAPLSRRSGKSPVQMT